MMNLEFSDLKNIFNSTRYVIDTIRKCVVDPPRESNACRPTDSEVLPISTNTHLHSPRNILDNYAVNDLSYSKQRKELQKQRKDVHHEKKQHKVDCQNELLQRKEHVDKEQIQTTELPEERSVPNAQKDATNKDAQRSNNTITDSNLNQSSVLNVSGFSVRVVDSSWMHKQDVVRGLSESLREIFLNSPERSATDFATASPLVELSDIDTSIESHISDSSYASPRTDCSENDGANLSSSFESDASLSSQDIKDYNPKALNSLESSRWSYQYSGSDKSDSSVQTNLNDSIYRNDNDSRSIYSSTDHNYTGSGTQSDISSGADSEAFAGANNLRESVANILKEGYENAEKDVNSKSYSADSMPLKDDSSSIGSNQQDAEELLDKQSESSAALQEFQHDIDFLATCTNKMSTPDKRNSIPDQDEPFEDTGSHNNCSTDLDSSNASSCSTTADSSSFISSAGSSDTAFASTTDSGALSDVDSSFSQSQSPGSPQIQSPSWSNKLSKFVHGISPLCKVNATKSPTSSQSGAKKIIRRRIIVVNRSLHDKTVNKSVNEKDRPISPKQDPGVHVFKRPSPIRPSPKVRRKIVFTSKRVASVDISPLSSPKLQTIDLGSDKVQTATVPTELDGVTYDAFDIMEHCKPYDRLQILPKYAFEDETEEAVYYLVTKYLENEECTW